MASTRPISERTRGEAGDTLIEVMIGAAILGVIVLGTLAGFDIAGHQSVGQRQYVEAQALADQGEDELAALNVGSLRLADSQANKTITTGGTTYTIGRGI